jgi:putative ABC transport system permease protein
VASLALGVFGLALVQAFQGSVLESLSERSRALLGADLSVAARRALTDEEERLLRDALQGLQYRRAQGVELFSMVSSPRGTRLIEVVAIESQFPFYGALELRGGGKLEGEGRVWIDPELEVQLQLKVGERVRIGTGEFLIADAVSADSGNAWKGNTLAPRIYMDLRELSKTGLVQKGTTARYKAFFAFSPETDLQAVSQKLDRTLSDNAIQIVTHEKSSEQIGRMLGLLSDYLGLISLMSLFLSALGAAFLFREALRARRKELAIRMSLGLTQAEVFWQDLLRLVLLGAAGAVVALVILAIALPWATGALSGTFSFDVPPRISALTIAISLGVGALGGLWACLPVLMQVWRLRPALVFQEGEGSETARAPLWAWVPGLLVFYALSVWQAHSFRVGSLFFVAFLASGAILGLAVVGALRGLERVSVRGPLSLRLLARSLSRARATTATAFVVLGLGSLLMNLIPQLELNVRTELEAPESGKVPSLFLFDIQEDQLEGVLKLARERGARPGEPSPLIRGRLESINGEAFEKRMDERKALTREEEQENRFRNRGFNLTYRAKLTESEEIVEGRPAVEPEDVSLEYRFAERIGARVGDRLVFDIQGVSLEGKVANLRKVQWTSFQPNFFVQFPLGVLDDAPKTFLLSIGRMESAPKLELQNAMVEKYPNVSAVDVSSVVERLIKVFGQMGQAVAWMAWIALVSGFGVLFSIARHQARTRVREVQVLKALGADSGLVRRLMLGESLLIALGAALLGIGLSFGMSYGISVFIFDGVWVFDPVIPLRTLVGMLAMTLALSWLASLEATRARPAGLLQDEGALLR